VEDDEEDSISRTLDELKAHLRDANLEPTTRYMLVLSKAAIVQSRVAYEGTRSQERLVLRLVVATWALVIATLVVAVVAIWK
jgi:hypothetical protein